MSYIDFFQFKDHPFRITPDVEFYYTSQTHSHAYESLKYFIESNEGFFTLIGEPGTGKTITIRKFLNGLPDDVEYAYILFPSLQPEDMFRAVLEDFGYKIEQGVSKNTLFSGFRDFLTEKKLQGKKILLIVDEAQNLPVETLEELRILSNLETEKEKLIQFILAGQPELGQKLNSERLRQLKQRISLHSELNLLDATEVERYVVFRLSKAGFNGKYPDKKFYQKLMSLTKGNPRLINLTMERALMSAFLSQSRFMTLKDLDSAAESLSLESELPAHKNNSVLTYILIGIIILLSLSTGYLYIQKTTPQKTHVEITKEEPAPAPAVEQAVKPEPQPEPIVEKPAPQPAVQKAPVGYITVDGLNLRSTPTIKEKNIIAKLGKGTEVEIVAIAGDWISIKTTEDGTGWVFSKFVIIPN